MKAARLLCVRCLRRASVLELVVLLRTSHRDAEAQYRGKYDQYRDAAQYNTYWRARILLNRTRRSRRAVAEAPDTAYHDEGDSTDGHRSTLMPNLRVDETRVKRNTIGMGLIESDRRTSQSLRIL